MIKGIIVFAVALLAAGQAWGAAVPVFGSAVQQIGFPFEPDCRVSLASLDGYVSISFTNQVSTGCESGGRTVQPTYNSGVAEIGPDVSPFFQYYLGGGGGMLTLFDFSGSVIASTALISYVTLVDTVHDGRDVTYTYGISGGQVGGSPVRVTPEPNFTFCAGMMLFAGAAGLRLRRLRSLN